VPGDPQADLKNRAPVWQALSELFLDTSLDLADRDRIAAVLAASPYSTTELDEILLWEVYPVCWSNLFSIAGEWSEFDPEWLQKRILHGPSLLRRVWAAIFGRVSVYCFVEWRRSKARAQVKRADR
jgi:hypothetical protein